jgi:predicted KAP-like P-loop ATPase
MIRVIRSKTLRDLREKADRLADFEKAQAAAETVLGSMSRKERRRAWKQSWAELPEPESPDLSS